MNSTASGPRRMSSLASDGPRPIRPPASARAHGYARASDVSSPRAADGVSTRSLRRSRGLPVLMTLLLGIATHAGIARVHGKNEVLELGAEIALLTEQRTALMERKRRLEAERAYLRHPERVRTLATETLAMVPTPPERVQRIELLGGATTGVRGARITPGGRGSTRHELHGSSSGAR